MNILFSTHKNHFAIKTLAFTLAETLIVIGVIGIVSALTLPNLNSSTGNAEKVAKVKKVYQNLQDAYGRAEAVYGPLVTWPNYGGLITKNLGQRLVEFMKIQKVVNDDDDYQEYILADGVYIEVFTAGGVSESYSYYQGGNYLGGISVDIDGPNKGKNQFGTDKFRFDITSQGIYPDGIADGDLASKCFDKGYCARWVIETGNMDYLKANSSGLCPNGIQLSWTTTSCK